MKMNRDTLISIIIGIGMFIIILILTILILFQMGERFRSDCEKQNNQGILNYWDMDIDCSQYYVDFGNVNTNDWGKAEE